MFIWIENLQRKDVDAMDVAQALKKDMDLLSHGEKLSVHQLVGKINIGLSQPEIYRYLSLLNLTPEVQEMVSEDKLGVKLASQLATVEKEKQEEVQKEVQPIQN
jgi:ParB-like chromosome segregation protein Spo0J